MNVGILELTPLPFLTPCRLLAQELMNGATASLYDTGLAATLREAWVQPSIEKLTAELSATYSGSKLQEAILEKLTTSVDKARKWFEPGACFAAGTLVHTKEGLVPIEQIKVGDYVLSKPENGGQQEYKRVLQTFAHAPERVINVLYSFDDDKNRLFPITATVNHPFWVAGEGWTAAENLRDYWTVERKLKLCDGNHVITGGIRHIYVSEQPGVGWMSGSNFNDIEALGGLWDFVNHRLVANEVPVLEAIEYEEHPEPFLKLPVYNLEVEDFHTYYVGKHGVWVHNQNCGGLSFEGGGLASRQMPALIYLLNGRQTHF
ncbi:MAG: polymorphic toxin-type HINT domain-containing protein [Gallionella sp.]|nr:polymorphic toxin-type HINT domain-containing protein [Gallionella sp.]MDD4959264.1 polymorphic toxin-type HINT domain-containing protein [Gallionella sp.]